MKRNSNLALHGGEPVRQTTLPYGTHSIDEGDIESVVGVLRSGWLTTGPKVTEFEQTFAEFVRAPHARSVSSGTAGLHAAMHALEIGPGDEVIVPALTFAATANAVVYQGGTPVFADVDPRTLLLDPLQVESNLTSRTKAIVGVDYAGQPCDYSALQNLADRQGLGLVADACHSLGARDLGRPVGSLSHLSVFSMHPVKSITSGEGGVVTTSDAAMANRISLFRNHGLSKDHRQRNEEASWFYEIRELGYNYRLSDLQCALATSQLRKLPSWLEQRRSIAKRYDSALAGCGQVVPVQTRAGVLHARHLYVIRLRLDRLKVDRAQIFKALQHEGIGVNVHYVPVHLHPFYRRVLGTGSGLCPVAETAYEEILSLPIFPAMTDRDVDDVVQALFKVLNAYSRTRFHQLSKSFGRDRSNPSRPFSGDTGKTQWVQPL